MTFDDFVTARLSALLRYTTTLTFDTHLAEDIVQEVLVRAERRWKRIEAMAAPESYVKRMIVNEFVSWRRRRSARDVLLVHEELDAATPVLSDPTAGYVERAEMLSRIAALPPKQRAVLMLRFYDDLPDAEIAEIIGCRVATVRSHVSHALATLRTATTESPTPSLLER